MRINFVLPPCPTISGGPLAILEYANRFIDLGHTVTITTYPNDMWSGDSPFPWFKFKGEILYKHFRDFPKSDDEIRGSISSKAGIRDLSDQIIQKGGLSALRDVVTGSGGFIPERLPFELLQTEILTWLHVMDVIPDCDLNIATFWATAFPVYYSFKGKPVFFMQHYEEVFYPLLPSLLIHKLMARMAYELPMFKVANSSWLQSLIANRFGQKVPFSNNAIEVADFSPRAKASETDGIIRVVTYARPEEWKGFADAVACMALVRQRSKNPVIWNVFGYRHPELLENNGYASYSYHPKLSFPELAQLYATADIALCPSWYESFPLPPLEAMASGTATVTTESGTEDYAFNEDTALVVKARDISSMADAVLKLINDVSLREKLASAGRKLAEKFNWEKAVAEREEILKAIFDGTVDYNPETPAGNCLADANGIAFEAGPIESKAFEGGLVWSSGALYLTSGGSKRHIMSADLIPILLDRGFRYSEVDALTFARIPTASAIRREADIPRVVG